MGIHDDLLSIRGLSTTLRTRGGRAMAVDNVDLRLEPGQALGVVGESGSGKTMLAKSILRLVPDPPARIIGGKVLLRGRNLLDLPEAGMRKVRGNRISMIFQEPMTSLNPVLTIGDQLSEVFILHKGLSKSQAMKASAGMLDKVGIPNPRERLASYPHEMSGGMRQRVVIAMALACAPDIILADEPTTALDVTIQAQILDLLLELQEKEGAAVLMITHDLNVIARTCRNVMVMYAGRMVELTTVEDIFRRPGHPYSKGLLACMPRPGALLEPIAGMVPNLFALPGGCAFHPRCKEAMVKCALEEPPLFELSSERKIRCWLYA